MNDNNSKKILLEKIDNLYAELTLISDKINLDRADSNEEESTIRQELLDKQTIIEQKIFELKDALTKNTTETFGESYTIEINGIRKEITIVNPTEADPGLGLISSESPLGLAIKNVSPTNKIIVNTPAGNIEYSLIK